MRDRITGRTVALKTLSAGATDHEVQALVREAVALSGVEGLGVPRVLRFGRSPAGRSYMVRELVEGQSLADLIVAGGDPLAQLDAIARAADQLTRLHRALLLHGDVKPANIIVPATTAGRRWSIWASPRPGARAARSPRGSRRGTPRPSSSRARRSRCGPKSTALGAPGR